MKKLVAFAVFALVSLAATAAHAQSTISPVPGAKDTPHETSPSNVPSQDAYGSQKSADQKLNTKHSGNYTDGTDTKNARRAGKHKMKSKNMSTTGSM